MVKILSVAAGAEATRHVENNRAATTGVRPGLVFCCGQLSRLLKTHRHRFIAGHLTPIKSAHAGHPPWYPGIRTRNSHGSVRTFGSSAATVYALFPLKLLPLQIMAPFSHLPAAHP